MPNEAYELIDFGDGRKLESIAGHWIDRPSPAADDRPRRLPALWNDAAARFDAVTRSWQHRADWPAKLQVDCGAFRMPTQPKPFGHIGLFPEQAEHWRWLGDAPWNNGCNARALNLFAYTGASTIALANAGYRVAHVDAARPNVQAARLAAAANAMADAPIRFLVDDAAKFAAREVRRGVVYETIVLDPPSYGHSPRGQAWRIHRDLWGLLETCTELVRPERFRMLVTAHTGDLEPAEIAQFLRNRVAAVDSVAATNLNLAVGRSQLTDRSGRKLDAGFYVRVQSGIDGD